MPYAMIIIAIGVAILAYLLFKPKKVAEITAFEWSPDNESWERLDGATINVGAWFLKMSWTNTLDKEIYYLGSFTWNGEVKTGETFALANGEGALTLTGSGLPGTYTATAKLLMETGEVIDSVSATYTVVG